MPSNPTCRALQSTNWSVKRRFASRRQHTVHTSAYSVDASGEHLKNWICKHGGYLHPALIVSTDTPSRRRGVLAKFAFERDPEQAVAEIPLALRITPEVARQALDPKMIARQLCGIEALDDNDQLALFLAHERSKGDSSFWAPYIAALPAVPPCGWLKGPETLQRDYQQRLHRHGLDLDWWTFFVTQAREQVQAQSAHLAQRYGDVLSVSRDDVLWSIGQVQSRHLTVDGQAILEPFADLLTYHVGAAGSSIAEWSYSLDRTGTDVVSRACLPASRPHMAAGEELCNRHPAQLFIEQHRHLTPLTAYLMYGEVPAQLWDMQMRTSDQLWLLRQQTQAAQQHAEHDTSPPEPTSSSESAVANGASSSAADDSSIDGGSRTVLWDYLTVQYHSDALAVLEAAPPRYRALLLESLLQPPGSNNVTERIAKLDEVMLAAIDAAEAQEAQDQQ